MQNRKIIEEAIKGDPTATPEQKKRVLDALKDTPPNARPKLIDRKQAAKILDCCVMTIRRMEMRDELTPRRCGQRRIKFNEEEVLEIARSGIPQGNKNN